jgi:hypothetical protein
MARARQDDAHSNFSFGSAKGIEHGTHGRLGIERAREGILRAQGYALSAGCVSRVKIARVLVRR